MTGEVTLRGKVLPVGGVKDKILGAYRANLKHIVIPQANAKDLLELPAEVKEHLSFYPIEHVSELLDLALINDFDEVDSPVELLEDSIPLHELEPIVEPSPSEVEQ